MTETKKKVRLSEQPTRLAVITDREIAAILGGLIGGLAQHCDIDKVRRAIRWWAETDEVWNQFETLTADVGKIDPEKDTQENS